MSLVQRVTAIEGTDRQPPALPEEWRTPGLSPQVTHSGFGSSAAHGYSGYGTITEPYGTLRQASVTSLRPKGSVRSLRRVLSFDALQATQASVPPTGGKYAYKVSSVKRLGEFASRPLMTRARRPPMLTMSQRRCVQPYCSVGLLPVSCSDLPH